MLLPGLLLDGELKQASLSVTTCHIPFWSQNIPCRGLQQALSHLIDLLRPLQVMSHASPGLAAAEVYGLTLQRGLQQACN